MQQCQIFDDSLRFSRAVYGLMVLLSIIIHSPWLLLLTAILTLLGAVSLKINIFYQFHLLVIKKLSRRPTSPVTKDSAELKFVAAATGLLLLVGFFWINSGRALELAWIYVLIVDLLIFLACFVGFCVATLMYVLIKKILKK
jgi:sensor histidine kinase YesM